MKQLRRIFQPYYLLALLVAAGIFWFDARQREIATAFFGFAENLETEINFNYPVIVRAIPVEEGRVVARGEPLLHLQRIQPEEELAEEDYEIAELRAEARAWQSEKEGELKALDARYRIEQRELTAEIETLEREIEHRRRLFGDLTTLRDLPLEFTTLENELRALREEKTLRDSLYRQERTNLREELRVGEGPYHSEIERLEARRRFDEAQRVVDIEIAAPFDGIVGNISCKEGEHIPSFNTLMTFYEPNPTLVKGYIYEDQLTNVTMGDRFLVRSTTHPDQTTRGTVTGLGSRVVSIPPRLRRIPEVETYGREVVVSIPADNPFIQKEKVVLEME